MDDHQLLFEIEAMIAAERLRPKENDVRDIHYSAQHIKTLSAIRDRLKELSDEAYARKLSERLKAKDIS